MKLIVINTHIEQEERSKMNNLSFYNKKQGKEEQIKSKRNKRKEVIVI